MGVDGDFIWDYGFGAGFKGFMMRLCVNKVTHASEAVKRWKFSVEIVVYLMV